MMTVIAVAGWLLFACVALLYWVGNRLNAKETNALAAYCLALVFSDEFHSSVGAGYKRAAEETLASGHTVPTVFLGLIQAVTTGAKRHFQPDAEVSSLDVVNAALAKVTRN